MQAVILAAGKGTRMGALTESTPKPMLLIHKRPVLAYVIDALPESVDEVIIIVGYLGSAIQNHFGGTYKNKKLFYVEQEQLNGTAGALWAAKDLLKDKFLVMNGDDICAPEDIMKCAISVDWAMLVQDLDEIGSFGKVITDERGYVTDILEKEVHEGGPGLVNTANFFLLDTRIFSYPLVLRPESTTEFGLPQTVAAAAREVPLHTVKAHTIIRLTEPEDLKNAEEMLAG